MTTPAPPPLPDLAGRTILITGANTGIGRSMAGQLAGTGARLLLACRSEERARPVLAEIAAAHGPDRARLIVVDLANLASVRAAAATVAASTDRLHLLINNAGVAGHRGTTSDGFELAFGVNHLGHFLLTLLLMPLLRAAASPGGARIVNVSSRAHFSAPGVDFPSLRAPTRTFTGLREYAVSKLCNILFTRALARRLAESGVVPVAAHPGAVASDIWRRLPPPARAIALRFMLPNQEGARRVLHPALSPAVLPGAYYAHYEPREPSVPARDEPLQEQLWTQSAAWASADL